MTLRDADVFTDAPDVAVETWIVRRTAKAVLVNDRQEIALVGNTVHDFLLLPGGGIAEEEEVRAGCMRECREETGCVIELTQELGITHDYRARDKRHSINYGFLGKVISNGTPELTESEIDVGLFTRWVSEAEAMHLFETQAAMVKEGRVGFYNTAFNILRDKFFLEAALRLTRAS